MTETPWTPGPWKVSGTLTRGRHCIDGKGGTPVAVTENTGGKVAEANARLIAAAPELAEALNSLLKLHIAHHNAPQHAAARAAFRAAGHPDYQGGE